MSSNQYRVFVCTKQRSENHREGCCCNAGALDVYQTFQSEVDRLGISDRVKVRKSGCLDRCEQGAVVLVCQSNRLDFAWLPNKLRMKLKKLFFSNRHLYGNLSAEDVKAIAASHLAKGKAVKKLQISTTN
ncbi:MAG: (2Fe-2S) ferredoxin domain-containing protein [Waterburya sp.]